MRTLASALRAAGASSAAGAFRLAIATLGLSGCIALFDFADYREPFAATDAGATDAANAPTITLSPLASVSGLREAPIDVPIAIERRGLAGAIVVSVSDLPQSIVASPVTIADGMNSGTLRLVPGAATPLGLFNGVVLAELQGSTGATDHTILTGSIVGTRLDPSFGDGGLVIENGDGALQEVAFDEGRLYYGGIWTNGDGGTSTQSPRVYRQDDAGVFRSVLSGGLSVEGPDMRFAPSTRGSVVYAVFTESSTPSLARFDLAETKSWQTDLPLDRPVTVVTHDRSIYVVAAQFQGTDLRPALVRVDDTGELDRSIGDAGVIVAPSAPQTTDEPRAAIVTDRGVVVCATHNLLDRLGSGIALYQFRFDGTLDPTFGTGGYVAVGRQADGALSCDGLAVSSERIFVATTSSPLPPAMQARALLAAFDRTGLLLDGFGDRGFLELDDAEAVTSAIAVDEARDRVYVAGTYQLPGKTSQAAVFARRLDGTLDRRVGGTTLGVVRVTSSDQSQSMGVFLLPDGRILLAGAMDGAPGQRMPFFARFLP